jgi:hypothetical protein
VPGTRISGVDAQRKRAFRLFTGALHQGRHWQDRTRTMRSYPVSTRVNQVVNDDEQYSAPVQPAQIQNQLFS